MKVMVLHYCQYACAWEMRGVLLLRFDHSQLILAKTHPSRDITYCTLLANRLNITWATPTG